MISFRIDWFDLLAVQGTLKSFLQHHSLKASVLQFSALFVVQGTLKGLLQHGSFKGSVLWYSAFVMVQISPLYMTTGKTIALTIWTFVGKVMSLLFNSQSRFVLVFLPRSGCLISAVL